MLLSADEPAGHPPSTRVLDLLLDDYERSLVLRWQSERELTPIVRRLREALEHWLVAPDLVDVLDQAQAARVAYIRAMTRWQPLLHEWLPIRDSGARLAGRIPQMTAAQQSRFADLQRWEERDSERIPDLDFEHPAAVSLLLEFEAEMLGGASE